MLELARGEYINALHAFLKGDHWQDAAYIAERVLTVSELKKLVDKEWPPIAEDDGIKKGADSSLQIYGEKDSTGVQIRNLLARRLAREHRFSEARIYFPTVNRPLLDTYAKLYQQSLNQKLSKSARADALWQTAQFLAENGFNLLATEVEPDAFVFEGAFPESNVAKDRMFGNYIATHDVTVRDPTQPNSYTSVEVQSLKKLIVPATKSEKRRLANHQITPDIRYHYRLLAADLAWRAAKLMPDHSEQTALVLCTAGNWVKNLGQYETPENDTLGDRFYEAILARCPNTEIGKRAAQKHWLPNLPLN